MGERGDERVLGIFTSIRDQSIVDRYIQAQFREHAEEYTRTFDEERHRHYRRLLDTAFGKAGLDPQQRRGMTILDIGSGGGNTIFSLLEACPGAKIIGSDLSVEMLIQFKQAMIARDLGESCALLQLNAEELDFRPETFDLVLGFAVLHHLFSPDRTVVACKSILKPGGVAIFFEPFEEGRTVLNACYAEILRHPEAGSLPPDVSNLLAGIIRNIELIRSLDRSSPAYEREDDKWAFHRAYFLGLAKGCGFSECIMYPLQAPEALFEKHTEMLLRMAIKRPREALPDWAWQMIRDLDESIPPDKKHDLPIEGCIIFKK